MPNSESVGKKIVEALKKQADNIEMTDDTGIETGHGSVSINNTDDIFDINNNDLFTQPEPQLQKPRKSKPFYFLH